MSNRSWFGIVGTIVAMVALFTMPAWRALAQSRLVVWPSAAIKWTDTPVVKGARLAVLWGDPAKGAYGALRQVPGGSVLALHTHKNDSRVIVVKGTVGFEAEGRTTELAPGSYIMIPGGLPHVATCKGAVACEYFEEMSGAFDSTPVKK
jgi:quercetin dioxygenase-like cupin family protein